MYEETDVKVTDLIKEFEDDLIDIESEAGNLDERFDKIVKLLEVPYSKAVGFEDSKDEKKAMEWYFVTLGMIKKILEYDTLQTDYRQGNRLFQDILKKYDLPSSLRMCNILFQAGNYTEVEFLCERILAIDSKNSTAISYQRCLAEAAKDEEWRRLSKTKDIRSYVIEYQKIQDEKKEKIRKAKVQKGELIERKNSNYLEVIIQSVLTIFYTIIRYIYETTVQTAQILKKIPVLSSVLRIFNPLSNLFQEISNTLRNGKTRTSTGEQEMQASQKLNNDYDDQKI